MTVLHLTRDLPPRIRGGISTAVGGLVDAAARAGVEQAVVSFDGWRPRGGPSGADPVESRTASGVPVLRVGEPAHLDAARAFARRVVPTLAIVHHGMLFQAGRDLAGGAAVALFAHVAQAALSALRGLDEETMSARAQRQALAEADVVWVPSEAAAALIGGACTVLPLGIPRRTGVRRWDERVLVVGRFDASKGTADALAAVGEVLARRPQTRFAFAGGLPDSRKSEERWVRRWSQAANAAEREAVDFLGWQDPHEIANLQASAALVLAPSHLETFGLSVLEAQLQGAIVLASNIPAHRGLITDGLDGLLVEAGDTEALADRIVSALEVPPTAIRERARTAAQAAVWERRIHTHLRAWRALG